MEFPKKETDIESLGFSLVSGLATHVADFPAPPVAPDVFGPIMSEFQAAKRALSDAEGAYEAAVTAKTEALNAMVTAMKKDLRYAENVTDYNNDKLVLLGWGGRKAPTPTTPPGQARQLTATEQGEGWLKLTWLTPAEGGKVGTYSVDRRPRTEGSWTQIASTYDRSITLENQPRGVEMEYRVIASNKAGEGLASNSVMVVL